MTEAASRPDLPARDPGLPRLLLVIAACAVAGAGAVFVGERQPSGASGPIAGAGTRSPGSALTGADLYLREGCGECHALEGPDTALGPSLAHVLVRADSRLHDPGYTGAAATPSEYVREATLDHCVDLLPTYACPQVPELALRMSAEDVDRLTSFLAGMGTAGAP